MAPRTSHDPLPDDDDPAWELRMATEAPALVVMEAASRRVVIGDRRLDLLWRLSAEPDRAARWPALHDGSPLDVGEWPLAQSLRDGREVHDASLEILRADGTRGHLTLDTAPLRGPHGEILAVVGIFRDDDDTNAHPAPVLPTSLLRNDADASAAARLIADADHRLRTPLTALQTHLHLARLRLHGANGPAGAANAHVSAALAEAERLGVAVGRLRALMRRATPSP